MPTAKRWLGAALALVVAGWMGCAPHSGPNVAPRMTGHFARAGRLYGAVAGGDLDQVRVEGEALIADETGAGMGSKGQPYVCLL